MDVQIINNFQHEMQGEIPLGGASGGHITYIGLKSLFPTCL